ncbi:MAG: parvulin-like peptidyl-prolyl isomerase [Eubacterium sp.]|nr:parvulin-like peptidyl-prolyl isomerase [Eubacterium sp.]
MENQNADVKKSSKGLIAGVVAAAVIIITAVILFVFQPWSAGYVATVDNQKITKQEYTFFSKFNMTQFLSSIPNNTKTVDQYDWKTKVGTETAKDQVKKSTLENLQEIKIQIVKAKEAGIKLTSEDLKNIDDVINNQITQSGSRNAAEAAIKSQYGVSLSEYKEVYKDFALAQKYQTQENSKITVTDDEVKKYYDENKKEFDKVTVTHILIKTVDDNGVAVSEGKKAEAKKKAEELLAKVKAGEDIKALAEKYSEDKPAVTTKDGTGYQGVYTFGKGEMVSQFEEWAFGDRKAGDADIVETTYGYHVMQFDKRIDTPFDDVKASIKTGLTSKKSSEEYTKKMEAWKKDAKYQIKLNESSIAKVDKSLYRV